MKNILIFGGSSDLGLSLAKFLMSKGNRVIVTYNTRKVSEIEAIHCDIRDEKDIDNTIREVLDKYHHIDMLINMAAISIDNEIADITKSDLLNILEVNLVGSFLTSKIYNKYVTDGTIINISSTDGIDTYNQYNLGYALSKSGMIFLSNNLRLCTNNKIFCISPNWIDSDSTNAINPDYLANELKRIGQSRLITKAEFNSGIYQIIDKEDSGNYRLDIKDDKLWIEKI